MVNNIWDKKESTNTQNTFFECSPPTHIFWNIFDLPSDISPWHSMYFYVTFYGIPCETYSHNLCCILSDIYTEILSGVWSDILSSILSHILSRILSAMLFGILSGILSGNKPGIYILAYSWAFCLTYILISGILYSSIWHSIWQLLFLEDCSLYLTSILIFCLVFHLAYILTFFPTCFRVRVRPAQTAVEHELLELAVSWHFLWDQGPRGGGGEVALLLESTLTWQLGQHGVLTNHPAFLGRTWANKTPTSMSSKRW